MKKIIALLLALIATPALALNNSNIPTKFPLTWGQNAGSAYIRTIPTNSQIGIQNGAASLNDGFPPLTFTPVSAGGVPPFGQDMNGILNQLSAWGQWEGAGGPVSYDSGFSASISGYPKGAILSATNFGQFWLNQIDGNTSNPDSGGANWIGFSPVYPFGVDAGTANAGSITLPMTVTALSQITGRPLTVQKISSANTGAYTLTVNTLTAAVHHIDGTALASGDLPAGGMFTVVYDGTYFDLQSPVQSATLGTAAAKAASDNTQAKVASVKGTITTGHLAAFADSNGTIQDAGSALGSYLQAPNNLSDLLSVPTARTNLGLGAIATLNVGTGLSSGGGNLNIATNGVSNSLLAQAGAFTLKGNNTSGTANETDLSISQVKSMLTGIGAQVYYGTQSGGILTTVYTSGGVSCSRVSTGIYSCNLGSTPLIVGYGTITGSFPSATSQRGWYWLTSGPFSANQTGVQAQFQNASNNNTDPSDVLFVFY